MSFWAFFRFLLRKRQAPAQAPAPVLTRRMEVGVVAHRLTPEDITAIKAMGVSNVRLSFYADGDGARWIFAAVRAGLSPLVVTYGRPVPPRDWCPNATWQIGNEPDFTTIPSSEAYVMTFRGDVPCGLRNDTPSKWMREFSSCLPSYMPLAIHIYGDSLPDAVRNRLADVDKITLALWVTEIGKVGGSGEEMTQAFELLDAAGVERCYVYALWSPDDQYTLTDSQRQAVTAWQQRPRRSA